jgi:hypothetical protein
MNTESKRKVTLVFTSVIKLWEFAQSLDKNQVEIDPKLRTLKCDCRPADIERAIFSYGASEQIHAEMPNGL